MTVDGDRGGFTVRNPVTGLKKRYSDEQEARDAAQAVGELVEETRARDSLTGARPKIAGLVTAWEKEQLQWQPWDEGTKRNYLCRMRRISRELGDRLIAKTDRGALYTWLNSFVNTGDQWNKWRKTLILLWDLAVLNKLAEKNEPALMPKRTASKLIPANRKARKQLTVETYKAIHDKAPPWLQLAMDVSLITLQARKEVCAMRFEHFRDGYLFVIRDKVSAKSDMAFIKIRLTQQLEEFRTRGRALDNVASPFLVHYMPEKKQRRVMDMKTERYGHWSAVAPEHLTHVFDDVRRETGLFNHLKRGERPSFH
jgi:hypothetical protein